jgi:hypothetical protein
MCAEKQTKTKLTQLHASFGSPVLPSLVDVFTVHLTHSERARLKARTHSQRWGRERVRKLGKAHNGKDNNTRKRATATRSVVVVVVVGEESNTKNATTTNSTELKRKNAKKTPVALDGERRRQGACSTDKRHVREREREEKLKEVREIVWVSVKKHPPLSSSAERRRKRNKKGSGHKREGVGLLFAKAALPPLSR